MRRSGVAKYAAVVSLVNSFSINIRSIAGDRPRVVLGYIRLGG